MRIEVSNNLVVFRYNGRLRLGLRNRLLLWLNPLKQPRLVPPLHTEQVRKEISQHSLRNKPHQSKTPIR